MTEGMRSALVSELARHLAAPFPETVEKGLDYGEVEPVMIDADLYGWASTVSLGKALNGDEVRRFRTARDELARSITALPLEAQPYFRRLLRIADLALQAA
jgi:hypothetical protein